MADADMDSNSSGSESSSDMEEDINEEEVKEEIKIYKKRISESKVDYEAHVSLIRSLKKLGELDELRATRNNFSKIYPLSPDLWMQWLSDEQSICTRDEERLEIAELFEKAVKDYVSVKIWVEYILFMLKGGKEEATRDVCDKALTAVGIHFADGVLVWQAVLLVEQQLFANLMAGDKKDLIPEQRKRIQNLYRRQARVPLLNMREDEFLAEAAEWFEGNIDSVMKNDIKQSSKVTSKLIPLETTLEVANGDVEKLEAYRKYLDFVRKNSNPAFIQITYERAVVELCLNAGLWEEYTKFAMEQFSFAEYIVLPICERAQRNCPWSSSLCSLRIRAFQKFKEDSKELHSLVKECLDKSLSSGVQDKDELTRIWMSYIVFLRMQINWDGEHEKSLEDFRESCYKAAAHIAEVVEDVDCEIMRYLVKIEVNFVRNFENVRTIYNDKVLYQGHNYSRTDLWLEYINLERSYGDTKKARKLFRRALEKVWDDVEGIAKEFARFEQEVGTVDTMEDFERRYKDRLAVVQKRRLEELAKQASNTHHTAKGDSYVGKGKKESHFASMKPIEKVVTEIRRKILPESSNMKASPAKMKRPSNETELPPPKKQKVDISHGENIKHDPSNDYRSVFLSNLDYTADKEQILPIFQNCGEVESFRLVMDFKGRSKGFGYLVFKQATSVKEALKCDRTPLGTRPMFVSQCDITKSGHSFQYSTELEKEKLFVRGLPISLNEQDIRNLFSQHFKIKELRLITHRNGYSKGCCYILYFSASDAEKVRHAMDGSEVSGRKITVLISNPTVKNVPNKSAFYDSAVPGTSQFRGGPKERLSFVPRALASKTIKEESVVPWALASKTIKEEENGNETMAQPKTNEEFRKMLLK